MDKLGDEIPGLVGKDIEGEGTGSYQGERDCQRLRPTELGIGGGEKTSETIGADDEQRQKGWRNLLRIRGSNPGGGKRKEEA